MAQARFRDYARNFLYIEDKRNGIVPFELNDAQLIVDDIIERLVAEGRPVRCLILKGRQQGMSTYCQGRIAHRAFTRRTRCLTVGHQLPSVHELYGKLDRAYKELGRSDTAKDLQKAGITLQPPLEPGMGEKGRRMVFDDPLGSVCRYDSAHDPESVGRGMTAQVMHLTEIPQWKKPEETMQALLATNPPLPGTMILVETTAKGASGWFYETWLRAIKAVARGETPRWVPIFVPWFRTAEYARPRESGEPELTKTELEFRDKYELTDEQCYWYRDQRDEFKEKVTEEYPSTWQEAFLHSGISYFLRETLDEYRQQTRRPIRVGTFVAADEENTSLIWKDEHGGAINIYGTPEEGHRYSAGIDFAGGRGKDRSAIVIADVDSPRVVATLASRTMLPDRVLEHGVALATIYHEALIVPERSGIGIALVDRLVAPKHMRGLAYTNVYREYDPVAVKYHGGARYGWATSNRGGSRQWLLEELARWIHDRKISIPCDQIVGELGTFVYTDETTQHAEATGGANDDLVMALAFAIRGISYLAPASPEQLERSDHRTPAERRAHISSATGY